jgi:hypothetical protein
MKIQNPGRAVGPARTLERKKPPVSGMEDSKLGGVSDLPAENQRQREQQLRDVARCLRQLDSSNDHVRKC